MMTSTSKLRPADLIPLSPIETIGCLRRSTRVMFRPVEGRVVVGVGAGGLGAERMIARRERLGRLGILDDAADLFADEIGDDRVAVDVDALIGPELGQHADQIALGPLLLEALAPLCVRELPADRGLYRKGYPDARQLRLRAIALAIALKLRPAIG